VAWRPVAPAAEQHAGAGWKTGGYFERLIFLKPRARIMDVRWATVTKWKRQIKQRHHEPLAYIKGRLGRVR